MFVVVFAPDCRRRRLNNKRKCGSIRLWCIEPIPGEYISEYATAGKSFAGFYLLVSWLLNDKNSSTIIPRYSNSLICVISTSFSKKKRLGTTSKPHKHWVVFGHSPTAYSLWTNCQIIWVLNSFANSSHSCWQHTYSVEVVWHWQTKYTTAWIL